MEEFFSAAIPLVLAGVSLAILAVNCIGNKKGREKQGAYIATGAGLGLLLGVTLNNCGLWENHILGLIAGPLLGMALGSLYQQAHDQ